jgi:carboxypeptidase Taq
VLERFGFDHESWRLDPTVHPFAMSAGTKDIRLTTRYDETDLSVSLFATIHEFGHGFYEANVDPRFERTSLSSVTSMSLHESQSRMWENLVGRGLPAWRFFYPKLQAAFPAQFENVELDEFYGAINKVQPSLIRVEADEATYNLHIILRFELEQEILSGDLPLADLPEAWNARMAEYLGIDVPNDGVGVLQDVHWSGGAIGYFPTYALGNVISVQLWDKLRGELPDLDSQFERGEFGELSAWLRENLHQHGRKYTSKEMLGRIVGGPMDPGPYLRYLKEKLGEIYGLPVEAGATA